jgi:CDP-diacylglycerol--serine O-phosphatidyltransferase
MKAHIPNILTIINLLAGIIGIYACSTANHQIVPVLMAIALIADFLDGFVARALNVKSELGKQLDSLADNVTFGALPGMMLVQLISMSKFAPSGSYGLNPLAFLGLAYAVGACYRLGKFNIDTRQTDSFLGLPTPAGGIFVLGLYMYFFEEAGKAEHGMLFNLIFQPLTLIGISIGLAVLMMSELPMFSLKGNVLKWKGNEIRMIFVVSSAALLLGFHSVGITLIIVAYILFSVIQWMSRSAVNSNNK